VTTEYKTKLTNFVKSDEFKDTLLSQWNSDSDSGPIDFVDVEVSSEEIPDYGWAIAVGIIGGIILLCLCACLLVYICSEPCSSWSCDPTCSCSKWSRPPEDWVNRTDGLCACCRHRVSASDREETNLFVNGMYSGHYKQYGQSWPMKAFQMKFDSVKMSVSGDGSDCVGDYSISGIYSTETQRMQIHKTYVRGTGNPHENLGHTVKIRLQWNERKKQFEGPWYVKTYKYEGTGKWVIQCCEALEHGDDDEDDVEMIALIGTGQARETQPVIGRERQKGQW